MISGPAGGGGPAARGSTWPRRPGCGTKACVHPTIVLAAPSPAPSPSCPDEFCGFIYRHTGVPWLATSGYYVLVKPLRIVLIVALAILARYLIHRFINRLVRSTTDDKRSR